MGTQTCGPLMAEIRGHVTEALVPTLRHFPLLGSQLDNMSQRPPPPLCARMGPWDVVFCSAECEGREVGQL